MRRQDIYWGKTLASTSLTKDLDPEYMRYSQNSTGRSKQPNLKIGKRLGQMLHRVVYNRWQIMKRHSLE